MNKNIVPILAILLILITGNGCITTSRIALTCDVNEDYLLTIPDSSQTVIVSKNNILADTLHNEVLGILFDRGHTIAVNDTVGKYIYTKGKLLGLATVQRMKIVTVDNMGNSKLSITAEWRPETDGAAVDQAMNLLPINADWQQAKWGINMAGVAFAECVALAKEIKGGEISFE